ncbi:MAG: SDR family NAD(P)-dependent oxidoreductase, partial [Luminiphilus sp.]|nr:SDR family NAD(P)-dependent oxidoreductase [Luminiphilus sp.]
VRIIAVGRTLAKCEATVNTIKERFGTEGAAIECDIGVIPDLDGLMASAVETFGRLDILVNNAVSAQITPLLEASIEGFELGLRVGPVASLRLMQLIQPHLLAAGGGNIINLASSAAMRWDSSNYGVYAAEKEAIRALTRAAANEWGSLGIRSNSILPLAQSPALAAWAKYRPEEAEAFMKTVPLERIGDCEQDIGDFVATLCSPESRFVNGQSIALDGGQVNLG